MSLSLRGFTKMVDSWWPIIFKGLVARCHSFCLFFIFYNIHTYIHPITFIQYIYPSPFAEASLHLLIAFKLSGEDIPVVPSRESNSGLPSSKPTHYQLSHAAPYEPRRTIMSHAAPCILLLVNKYWDNNDLYLFIYNKKPPRPLSIEQNI